MLIEDLGYRTPDKAEIQLSVRGYKPRFAFGRFKIPSAVVHADPLVSYSGITPRAPLGVASVLGLRMARETAWFLLSPTWSIEDEQVARSLRAAAVRHRLFRPRHRLVFMCNTEAEAQLMRRCGEAAVVHNKTTNISETLFRPLDGVRIEFDAIYNAQLAAFKRHELSVEIPTCAFIFYRGINSTNESEAALIAGHKAVAPDHVFINEFSETGLPVRLRPEEVNHHLNRAAVGLCLSAQEGAMFACAEYLLAGLPVVTTANRGGRDFYADGDICLTVDDNPRDVAAAVAALKARGIPRHQVRERTLRRIRAERNKLIDLVNAIYRECEVDEQFCGFWPLKHPVVMQWHYRGRARRRALRGRVDENVIRS